MKKYLIAVITLLAFIFSARSASAFDPRVNQMRAVLEKYHSPMVGMEDLLIKTAEENGLDWTLLAAIAGTESSFARRMPYQCNNPYGWGIYGSNKFCFETLEKSIVEVGNGLGKRYNTASLETIARTYNKVSTDGWIRHTRYFMNKIKNQEIAVSELPITL